MVDVAATEALLNKSADPAKAPVAARHQRERIEKNVTQYVQPSAPDLPNHVQTPAQSAAPSPDGSDSFSAFHQAKTKRETFLALLAENEYRKQVGELVERAKVEDAAFKIGRLQRDVLLGLPTKISAQFVGMTDAWEIEKLLVAQIRSTLADLAKMAESDMRNAMN